MLKVRKKQKEIIECAGGSCMNCNPDIKALSESIDILSDYKRVLKENEELKLKERRRIIGKYGEFEIHNVINRTLSNDYISVQKVKDKIEEYKNM